MNLWRRYAPRRIGKVFGFLLTVFLLIRRRDRLLWYRPLEPETLRDRITALGASFIKLAQVLATRADFFDDRYLEKLRQLHDEIPPMGKTDFERVFAAAFGEESPFGEFESAPIASASIGQVHRARLKDGTPVAVKLRRLGIAEQVEADLRILSLFNRLFRPLFSPYTRNSIDAVIAEFGEMIRKEVNLVTELGTVYIENFNGVKDILPILQRNIPRALGADKGPLELLNEEFRSAPLRLKQLHSAIQKASEGEMRVHLSERQIEWLAERLERRIKPLRRSVALLFASLFLLLVQGEETWLSWTLFGLGMVGLLW